MMNCPKAVRVVDGRAVIDTDRCVSCGICMRSVRTTPLSVPVPCERACPVGAVSKDEQGKERIDYSKCVLRIMYAGMSLRRHDGQVSDNRRTPREETGQKDCSPFAPAVAGQFRASLGQLFSALGEAGFDAVFEVALGADITAEKEAAEFLERMEAGEPFMTTSCCPAYVETVRKHIPTLAKRVSHTATPMHYTAELAAEECPDHLRVFIGPCLAKRKEGLDDPLVDYVLSVEELGALFVALGIDVSGMEDAPMQRNASASGRGFALAGGVAGAVMAQLPSDSVCTPVLVDGLTSTTIKMLSRWADGAAEGNLVEVMACTGGCIAGPSVIANPKVAAAQLRKGC